MTRSALRIVAVVFVCFACCVAPALAQEPAAPAENQDSSGGHGFGVQLLGGPLFANYTDVTGIDFARRTGYLVGVGFGGNRRGVVGVQADVLYGSKPVEIVGGGTSSRASYTSP